MFKCFSNVNDLVNQPLVTWNMLDMLDVSPCMHSIHNSSDTNPVSKRELDSFCFVAKQQSPSN